MSSVRCISPNESPTLMRVESFGSAQSQLGVDLNPRIESECSGPVSPIRAIDLFCGAGGLTRGLEEVGVNVVLGSDTNPLCQYPYTANNRAAFLLKPVEDTTATDLLSAFSDAPVKVLAGCAPCQPFSTYTHGHSWVQDDRWNLQRHFSRLVEETQPELVTMENVPRLKGAQVFRDFVTTLEGNAYAVSFRVVNCAEYGVPQNRRRLVLLGSKLGSIDIIEPTSVASGHQTVREAIGSMPPLEAGGICALDPLHRAASLSPLNLQRMRASRPGGTWREWGASLRAKCHTRSSGRSYASVYGRMTWDALAPTITTQYYGFGNGRFGHPEQDRALFLARRRDPSRLPGGL